MDPDSDWLNDDTLEESTDVASEAVVSADSEGRPAPVIPTGPPVPNPYAHMLDPPCRTRKFNHWARKKSLGYKYLTQYRQKYYEDYIDFLDKRQKGIDSDVPRAREWPERALKLYAKDGERLIADDFKYWYTTKNNIKPKAAIVHAVHSKDYYFRQYRGIMI